jgi:hypothetical protein
LAIFQRGSRRIFWALGEFDLIDAVSDYRCIPVRYLPQLSQPNAYFTTRAMDTCKKKVFWMVGPQCIGWFTGLMASNGFMKNVLGYQGLFA